MLFAEEGITRSLRLQTPPRQPLPARIDWHLPPIHAQKNGKNGHMHGLHEVVHYNVYHRHQYRRHHGVAPGNGYSRDYKLHKCTYCTYTSYDISNVHTHEKSHVLLRQHPCRHGCGAAFSTHAAEVLHCKRTHKGKGLSSVTTRVKRVGNRLEKVEKNRRTNFLINLV